MQTFSNFLLSKFSSWIYHIACFLINSTWTVIQAFVLSWCEAVRRVAVWVLPGVTLTTRLFVETIRCMDRQWGIAICILVIRRSDFRSPLSDIRWSRWFVWQYVPAVTVHIVRSSIWKSVLCMLSSGLGTCVKVKNVILSLVAVFRRGQDMLPLEMRSGRAHQVTDGPPNCQRNSVPCS